jgi:hypothetical protein
MASDLVHFVRQRPQLGVWMQTRCGVHVTRSSMENGKLFKTKKGSHRLVAVPPGSRLEITCRICRKRLGLTYKRGEYVAPGEQPIPSAPTPSGVLINGT